MQLSDLRYLLSSSLSVISPWQWREVWTQVRAEAALRARTGDRDPSPYEFQQQIDYTLPFAGEWLVVNGGVERETSHSWDLLSQRYAYDFVIADDAGNTHAGAGRRVDDYFCYGQPILAPADGVVVSIADGVRDAMHPGTGWVDWRAARIGGNSVTIRHAEREFSYLAHLQPGSIGVSPGQAVQCGEQIGRCGNSGHSTEPHLHFQLQDGPDLHHAMCLPVQFSRVLVDGQLHERVHLRRETRVQRA